MTQRIMPTRAQALVNVGPPALGTKWAEGREGRRERGRDEVKI